MGRNITESEPEPAAEETLGEHVTHTVRDAQPTGGDKATDLCVQENTSKS